MEIKRWFEYEKKLIEKKIKAGWFRDWMKIIAFSIDWSSITLYTDDMLPIWIKWDGKNLDFIDK